MDILLIIEYNLLALDDLRIYPELYRISRCTKVIVHLLAILHHMQSYSYPVWRHKEQDYFLFSIQHLAAWSQTKGWTGHIAGWQSHKVFLQHAGLIEIYPISGKQKDPFLKSVWQHAIDKGQRPESLWTVPLYTPEVLANADRIAKEYREKHINLSNITRDVILRSWGKRIADRLFRNSHHVLSNDKRAVLSCLKRATLDLIRRKGYTYEEELRSAAALLCAEATNIPACTYTKLIVNLMKQKRMLLDECGCEYHPIRKRDRVLALPEGFSKYIITRKSRQ